MARSRSALAILGAGDGDDEGDPFFGFLKKALGFVTGIGRKAQKTREIVREVLVPAPAPDEFEEEEEEEDGEDEF